MEQLDQTPLERLDLGEKLRGFFKGEDLLACLAQACRSGAKENE